MGQGERSSREAAKDGDDCQDMSELEERYR